MNDHNTQLESTYRRYKNAIRLDFDDPESQNDLHRYMCVRITGFLEQSLMTCVRVRVYSELEGEAARYVNRVFEINTAVPGEFIKQLSHLDASLGERFKKFISEDSRHDQLLALYKIRHETAHGRPYAGASSAIDGYFMLAVAISTFLVQEVVPAHLHARQLGAVI